MKTVRIYQTGGPEVLNYETRPSRRLRGAGAGGDQVHRRQLHRCIEPQGHQPA